MELNDILQTQQEPTFQTQNEVQLLICRFAARSDFLVSGGRMGQLAGQERDVFC